MNIFIKSIMSKKQSEYINLNIGEKVLTHLDVSDALKEIISKNQAANEKRFEVLFNILDSLNSQQQPQRKIIPQQKKVTIAPIIKKKPSPVLNKKNVTPIEEEEQVEEKVEEPVEDEVVDLEEETRSLLEEDVEEDIEA